jgi:hypothetical protein
MMREWSSRRASQKPSRTGKGSAEGYFWVNEKDTWANEKDAYRRNETAVF